MSKHSPGRAAVVELAQLHKDRRVGAGLADLEPTARPLDPLPALDQASLDLIPAAVYLCDAQGRITRCNQRACEWLGLAAMSPAPPRFYTVSGQAIAPEDTPVARALRSGQSQRSVELALERPDGARVRLLANVDALGGGIGAVVCCHVVEPHAFAATGHWLEGMLAILEISPDCIKVVDHDGTLLYMNPAGLRILQAANSAEVEGRSVFGLIAPDHREDWRARHLRVCTGERLRWEFDLVNLHGSLRHMETQAVPLSLPGRDGAPARVVQLAISRDIGQRKSHEATLRDSERRLRELLEALPIAIYTTDVAGRVTYFNQACVALAGRTPEIGSDEWCVTWRLYWPDGSFLPHDQCPMAIALKEERAIHGAEAMAERPDGTRVPFLAYPAPLRDASDAVVGAVNMLVDISERKRSEDQRHLLVNELNHRVKNTLATVQSMAAQSFRRESESDSYHWFEGRLVALSEAHDALSRENWETVALHDILVQVTAPLQEASRERLTIEGPAVRLRPKVALSLAMVLHELCTNAGKHGALSGGSGRILVQWRLSGNDDARTLHLRWQESGGAAVAMPQRKGFGSRLIEQGLARELGGEVRLTYAAEGVVCEIDVPL